MHIGHRSHPRFDAFREHLCAARRHGGGGRFGGHGPPFGGGRFPGGPPFGYAFFRRAARARRGDVRAAILVLLAEQPRNGYQLMQEIEQRSEGAWKPSPGAMYPALQQLEDEGLVRVEAHASGGRVFHLTAEGKRQAEGQTRGPAPWEGAPTEERDAAELREILHQVALATMQVAEAGAPSQLGEARKILVAARRSIYRVLAEEAPDDNENE